MRSSDAKITAVALCALLTLAGCDGEPGTDAGTDAGTDSGMMEMDSGTDAGTDAGGSDAGTDAGADAGGDAGGDAGADAAMPTATDYVYYSGDFTTDGEFNVGRRNIAMGTNEILSPMGLTNAAEVRAIALSPDGARLAIAGTATAGGMSVINIYAADGAGTPTTVFTSPAADRNAAQMAFSPDGLSIAFTGPFETTGMWDANDLALYVVPADGSGSATRLSQSVSAANLVVGDFTWVNDTHIAYLGDLDTNNVDSVWSVETSVPGSPIELIPSIERAMFTTSQDIFNDLIAVDSSSRIYFIGDFVGSNGEFHLYRNVLDGSAFEEVAGTAMTRGGTVPTSITTFGISADGATLAFAADATTADIDEIFVMALSGSTPARVDTIVSLDTFGQGPDAGDLLQFSPDGTQLAFDADYALAGGEPNASYSVFVVPTTGTGGTRLFGVPADAALDASQVFWSPDSTRIYARADYNLDRETELFGTMDLTTADQAVAGLTLVDAPTNGDVFRAVAATVP